MKEIMMTLGKLSEQDVLMEMIDRDDQRAEDTINFLQNFWKMLDQR